VILLVDDEPRVTEGLRRSMRGETWKIIEARSAKAALEVLAREAVDVVVSDESMPGMRGSEFLGLVCRNYPSTIRMILTGQASIDVAMRAVNDGEIYRFFLKPCCAEDLICSIRQGLQLRTLLRRNQELLRTVHQQAAILRELESANPGISAVARNEDGSIPIDE
jgi:DNA-binding NtrC family response regulator